MQKTSSLPPPPAMIVSRNVSDCVNSTAHEILEFEADPDLNNVNPSSLRDGIYQVDVNGSAEHPLRFGLPVVAGWRSFPSSLEPSYNELATDALECFTATTGFRVSGEVSEPEAHIYPFEDLHVTVVTFRPLLKPKSTEEVDAIKKFCWRVADGAVRRRDWPKSIDGEVSPKLCFRMKQIRLGKRNAILKWEELTGNLNIMRRCLREELEAQKRMHNMQNGRIGGDGADALSQLTLTVPDLVHSTFIRFWKAPSMPGKIQLMFEKARKDRILHAKIDVDLNIKLVCEDIPCMHIPVDYDHVLWGLDQCV
mmetsp:Transcript_15798/g.31580  ORF Transcript_15798/g.31580 Transcript_15798/m.31580 type:complete len:309 (-) Transcript_15798:1766-2692(-)